MTKEELYKQAYSYHYDSESFDKAEELYNEIINSYPGSNEAGYAKSQLDNIQKEKQNPKKRMNGVLDDGCEKVILTTTPSLEGYEVEKTIEIITSECVYGMNLFKDLFASFSDIFGGRSNTIQNTLKQARVNCLNELKKEAISVGANAVIGVKLDYSEFSGQGKSMLFLVASGTAVVVRKKEIVNSTL